MGNELTIVSREGGKPRTLLPATTELGAVESPRWSHSGKQIYFHCGQDFQICRIPSKGGDVQVITGAEGIVSDESPDEKWLYSSTLNLAGTPLRRVPVSGGRSTVVIPDVAGRNWVVVKNGIWYLARAELGTAFLRFYDFATQSSRDLFRTSLPVFEGLSVSPDQRRVLFAQSTTYMIGSDIMLVENFR